MKRSISQRIDIYRLFSSKRPSRHRSPRQRFNFMYLLSIWIDMPGIPSIPMWIECIILFRFDRMDAEAEAVAPIYAMKCRFRLWYILRCNSVRFRMMGKSSVATEWDMMTMLPRVKGATMTDSLSNEWCGIGAGGEMKRVGDGYGVPVTRTRSTYTIQ